MLAALCFQHLLLQVSSNFLQSGAAVHNLHTILNTNIKARFVSAQPLAVLAVVACSILGTRRHRAYQKGKAEAKRTREMQRKRDAVYQAEKALKESKRRQAWAPLGKRHIPRLRS